MPFIIPRGAPLGGAGDCVDAFSALIPAGIGEPELALLVGRCRSAPKACAEPFIAGAIRD